MTQITDRRELLVAASPADALAQFYKGKTAAR